MRQVGVMFCARESKQGEETIMSNEARGLVKANFKVALYQKGMTQKELVDATGLSMRTISRISTEGIISPVTAERIAPVLGVSDDYLRGKTKDPAHTVPMIPAGTVVKAHTQGARLDTSEKMEIPVLSTMYKACAGDGNGLDHIDEMEVMGTILIDADIIHTFDDTKTPFAVIVDGDSMAEMGIHDGDTVVVNPAESVGAGDIALVSYRGQWSVKGVLRNRDGSVKLLAGKSQYEMVVPRDAAEDEDWFRVIGRVVHVQPRGFQPKRFL